MCFKYVINQFIKSKQEVNRLFNYLEPGKTCLIPHLSVQQHHLRQLMKGSQVYAFQFQKERETSKLEIIIYGICSKAPFNKPILKIILPLYVIYILCKLDLPNHLIEF